jgi:hypothetical protein
MSYNSVEVHGVDQNQANQQAAGKLSIFWGEKGRGGTGLFGFYFSSPKWTPLSCLSFPFSFCLLEIQDSHWVMFLLFLPAVNFIQF